MVVDKLMASMPPDGTLLTIDNGYIGFFAPLRALWGAGRNHWTYLRKDELASALSGYDIVIRGFGFLNCGSARSASAGGPSSVNDIVYRLDKLLLGGSTLEGRAVLATVVRRRLFPEA
jgi:hypothetical protein